MTEPFQTSVLFAASFNLAVYPKARHTEGDFTLRLNDKEYHFNHPMLLAEFLAGLCWTKDYLALYDVDPELAQQAHWNAFAARWEETTPRAKEAKTQSISLDDLGL